MLHIGKQMTKNDKIYIAGHRGLVGSAIERKLEQEGLKCKCIRCREIREIEAIGEKAILFRQDYDASDGKEIFLSFENKKRTKLFSMLRLRIPSTYFENKKGILPALSDAALIREMHTYGRQIAISKKDSRATQHMGYGKKLLAKAEEIARNEFNIHKVTVIAGVGVREYFKKQGYELKDSYMVKGL